MVNYVLYLVKSNTNLRIGYKNRFKMNGTSNIKRQQIEFFKNKKIRQGTFLKTFRAEISELVSMDYKPKEIRDFFELNYEVKLNQEALYSWLRNNKNNLQKGETENEERSIDTSEEMSTEIPPQKNPSEGFNKEADVSKKDTPNDTERSAIVNVPEHKRLSKLDDDADLSDFVD